MRSILRCFIVLMILFLASSCSQTLKKPQWIFEKSAVRIHCKADEKLNLYNNKVHTLYVCFFQLRNLDAFDRLTVDPAGIRRLLECRLFDESVVFATSKVIHAGENITLTLDRAERAEYIAMVAGYSSELTNDRVVRRHKFQIHKMKKGIFKKVFTCEPCEQDVEVSLGANQIKYSKITPSEEMICNDECE